MNTASNFDLSQYQKEFIDFLIACEVLTFGDFVTKSGRKTPYFVNTGRFNTGARIARLGEFYASHIVHLGLSNVSTIFGPAYKGVPLCVTTAIALHQVHNHEVGFTFNRKEAKTHGDKGTTVGYKIVDNDKVLLVEDVITAGTTLREVIPFLRDLGEVEVTGVIISVDRCEKGTGSVSAVQQASDELGVTVYPLVTIHEIVQYLSSENSSGFTLTEDLQSAIAAYLEEYGA